MNDLTRRAIDNDHDRDRDKVEVARVPAIAALDAQTQPVYPSAPSIPPAEDQAWVPARE